MGASCLLVLGRTKEARVQLEAYVEAGLEPAHRWLLPNDIMHAISAAYKLVSLLAAEGDAAAAERQLSDAERREAELTGELAPAPIRVDMAAKEAARADVVAARRAGRWGAIIGTLTGGGRRSSTVNRLSQPHRHAIELQAFTADV